MAQIRDIPRNPGRVATLAIQLAQCRSIFLSAQVSGQFGTGAEVSSGLLPKCLGSEVSWVRSVLTPSTRTIYHVSRPAWTGPGHFRRTAPLLPRMGRCGWCINYPDRMETVSNLPQNYTKRHFPPPKLTETYIHRPWPKQLKFCLKVRLSPVKILSIGAQPQSHRASIWLWSKMILK